MGTKQNGEKLFGSATIDDFSQPKGSKPSPHIIPRCYLSGGGFIYFDAENKIEKYWLG
jgi:hypothetical protein